VHNNYYFLSELSKELTTKIVGATLLECFSQNKDELILGFSISAAADFYIKAHLSNQFSCLAFYDEFARAKRNSLDLFRNCIGLKIEKVIMHKNERAFSFKFNNKQYLTFKLFGRFSNIIHFDKKGAVIKLFNGQYDLDKSLKWNELDREICQTEACLDTNGIRATYPTISKWMWQGEPNQERLSFILDELDKKKYFLIHNEEIRLSMLTPKDYEKSYDSALVAITEFFHTYIKVFSLRQERKTATSILTKKIKGTENYIGQNEGKLVLLRNKVPYQQVGDILMANLHQITYHAEEVELFNFYNNEQITIKLKPRLSPQKNAENYYRKSKKFNIQLDNLASNIEGAKTRLSTYQQIIEDMSYVNNVKDLRKILEENGLTKKEKRKTEVELFKTFIYQDYTIYVGKNSKNNDLLTLKYTHKEDYWLHAKDVAGSHVVVKVKSGQDMPKPVLERAAELAAYYSKRKTDTLCPVTVTKKKYVRKPKGVPAGAVFVEKENVLLVEPKA